MDLAFHVDEHGLAGREIALELVARAFQRDRFAGDHHRAVGAAAQAQRPDAVRIAEGEHAVARDQRDHGIGAAHALVHVGDRREHVLRLQRQAAGGALQLVREHVHEHLGVALGVDMAVVGGEQLRLQGLRIGEVAVVRQRDAEGRIHVERLGLFLAVGVAGRRVAHLAQAHGAGQRAHVAGAEHVAHHALGLVHVDLAALQRDDARRILAAMLQQQQRVIDQLVDRALADDADDSAHVAIVPQGR